MNFRKSKNFCPRIGFGSKKIRKNFGRKKEYTWCMIINKFDIQALARLGLISWIGNLTEKVVLSVGEDSRLAVAILLILWVSAIASAFVDNVPLATMMVRIATDLSHNQTLNLPLQPLIWALAFGACMGGKKIDRFSESWEKKKQSPGKDIDVRFYQVMVL